jgi:cyanophycinase-like exopeptidase
MNPNIPAGRLTQRQRRWRHLGLAMACLAAAVAPALAQSTIGQRWEFNDAAILALPAVAGEGALPSQWIAGGIPASTSTDAAGSLRIGYNGTSTANSYAPVNTPPANAGGVYTVSAVFRAWDIRNGADSGSTRPVINLSLRSAATASNSIVAQAILTATPAGVVLTVRDTSSAIYPVATLPAALAGPVSIALSVDKSPSIKTYTVRYTIGGETFTQSGALDPGGNARVISHVSLGISGNFPGAGNVLPLIDRIQVETSPPPMVTIGAPADGRPGMRSDLLTFFDGNRVQSARAPQGGPALLLMGGGAEVNSTFASRAYPVVNGGDIVVLRTSGSNGYQNYFYNIIPAQLPEALRAALQPNSVETLFVDSRDKANSDYVEHAVRRANMIWMAGGDQSSYINNWRDTRLAAAVKQAYLRGAVVGGTSAGMVVAGEWMYDPGAFTAVTSAEAVANPYRPSMILSASKLFDLPLGFNLLGEPHFQDRDRMGRSLAFMARLRKDARTSLVYGVALDERTALFIDSLNIGTFERAPLVVGKAPGDGYILREDRRKTALVQVAPGLPLIYRNVLRTKLAPGQSFDFARGLTGAPTTPISVEGVVPANSY